MVTCNNKKVQSSVEKNAVGKRVCSFGSIKPKDLYATLGNQQCIFFYHKAAGKKYVGIIRPAELMKSKKESLPYVVSTLNKFYMSLNSLLCRNRLNYLIVLLHKGSGLETTIGEIEIIGHFVDTDNKYNDYGTELVSLNGERTSIMGYITKDYSFGSYPADSQVIENQCTPKVSEIISTPEEAPITPVSDTEATVETKETIEKAEKEPEPELTPLMQRNKNNKPTLIEVINQDRWVVNAMLESPQQVYEMFKVQKQALIAVNGTIPVKLAIMLGLDKWHDTNTSDQITRARAITENRKLLSQAIAKANTRLSLAEKLLSTTI